MREYTELKRRLARGWNTWNTRSLLSHVLLPEGFAINLGLKEYAGSNQLTEALIGRQGEHDEKIHPGIRAYDGSFTELTLTWQGIELLVQSGTDGDDLLLLVTPLSIANQVRTPVLTVQSALLWNREGALSRAGDTLLATLPTRDVRVFATCESVTDPYILATTPYFVLPLAGPVGISTGRNRTVVEIQQRLAAHKAALQAERAHYGELTDVYAALQTCLAWDTIYDPLHDRVVSPVSRNWNCGSGGYVLFCWDNYFAGYMAALDNKDIAYANVIEITREQTKDGFVPNFSSANGQSLDRSQPPVGSRMVYEIYRRYGERWLLDEVFDTLLTWNRWWIAHRQSADHGLLAWGSDPFEPITGNYWELNGVNERFGGALESGLDNSPMYDDIPFDTTRHQLMLADVGLNSLYIMDCRALAEIAEVLGKTDEVAELSTRAADYTARLQTLWHEETGLFLNRRTDTGAWSHRIAPTNFYPLIAGVATQAQAERMMAEHFYNPDEFWGDWIMPSIARNDPAYPDQDYWRGRIWAPMNFLVYLGLCNYDLPQARQDLVAKSTALLLKEWREHGHVHENYSGDTGEGCNKPNSDRFYHWGGLLGLIAFMEAGYYRQTPTA